MSDRAAFVRAIGDAWDDPTPVLVYADYAAENGLDDPELLRWYAGEVMPAVAAVPADGPPPEVYGVAARAMCAHPQGDILKRLAAAQYCRRPIIWDALPAEHGRCLVATARLFAIRLVTEDDRQAVWSAARKARSKWLLGRSLVEADLQTEHAWQISLGVAANEVDLWRVQRFPNGSFPEYNYQERLFEALSRVSPLARRRCDLH